MNADFLSINSREDLSFLDIKSMSISNHSSRKTNNIDIKTINFDQWENLWLKAIKANLLQSWFYGNSKKEENFEVIYFAISSSKKIVSIVQVLLKRLPLIGTVARVNRGPIVIGIYSDVEKEKILLDSINIVIEECRRRWWWMLQIAPELQPNDHIESTLSLMGLRKLSGPAWSSGLLDISSNENTILMSLKGRWRRGLRKGIKQGIKVSLASNTTPNVDQLIDLYKTFQAEKQFVGLSENLIRAMASKEDQANWKFNIFKANLLEDGDEDKFLGLLVSIEHGDTAIYLIGTTTDEGKKYQTNYVLFWEAILQAQKNGCQWFDIGGLNETTTKGIKQFKEGLNSNPYSLTGEWRGFFIPRFF